MNEKKGCVLPEASGWCRSLFCKAYCTGAVCSHREEKSDGLFDYKVRNEKGEETLK